MDQCQDYTVSDSCGSPLKFMPLFQMYGLCPLQKTNCHLFTSFGQAFRFKVVTGSSRFNEMRLETMIRNP